MLPKKNRLKLNDDFDKIFKAGHSCYGRFLGVRIIKNQKEYNRFGILVSIKVEKKATTRNLIKRRIKNALVNLEKNCKKGFDCAIIVLLKAKEADKQELEKDLIEIFQKLKIFNK